MLARDVMTMPVVTGKADSTVFDIVELMLKHQISAVPIVDKDERLIGIVSEGDLIQRDEIDTLPRRSWWLGAFGGKRMLAEDFLKSHGVNVANVMTETVETARPDTPLWKIAETLERKKIKRVPITEDGRVVGIVSRANLLQALSAQRALIEERPLSSDRDLREQILKALAAKSWADTAHLNIVVKEGTVYLWGLVESRSERDALCAAANGVAGVKDVVDHMHLSKTLI